MLRMPDSLTDSLTDFDLKDRATQLLTKYKSGALVTQLNIQNAQNGILCSLFRGKSCRSMEKKLFRVTEKLANSNSERKGVDKNSEIVSLNHLKHFMKN